MIVENVLFTLIHSIKFFDEYHLFFCFFLLQNQIKICPRLTMKWFSSKSFIFLHDEFSLFLFVRQIQSLNSFIFENETFLFQSSIVESTDVCFQFNLKSKCNDICKLFYNWDKSFRFVHSYEEFIEKKKTSTGDSTISLR